MPNSSKENLRYNLIGKLTEQIVKTNPDKESINNFLEKVNELLEIVNNTSDLEIENIVEKLDTLNKMFLGKTKNELETKADTEIVKISKSKEMTHQEEFRKIELQEQKVEEPQEIVLKPHDWNGYLYGRDGMNTHFGSKESFLSTNRSDFGKIKIAHAYAEKELSVLKFNKRSNKYILVYTPLNDFNDKYDTDGPPARGSGNPFVLLELSADELQKLTLDDEFRLKTEQDKILFEEMQRENRSEKYGREKMPKIKLPFSQNPLSLDEFDIEFVKLLNNFIEYLANFYRGLPKHPEIPYLYSRRYVDFDSLGNDIKTKLVINNDNSPLNLKELLSLARLFNKAKIYDKNFFVSKEDEEKMQWVYSEYLDYTYYKAINCGEIDLGKRYAENADFLTLNFKGGLCTEINLNILHDWIFLNQSKISQSLTAQIDRLNEEKEKCSKFKLKGGKPLEKEDIEYLITPLEKNIDHFKRISEKYNGDLINFYNEFETLYHQKLEKTSSHTDEKRK